MRKFITFAVFFCLILAALPAWAQEGEPGTLAQEYFITAKPGHEAQFEAGYKAHTEWHRANDPWTWHTWEVVNGKHLGQFIARTVEHHWADFDGREKMNEADGKHFTQYVLPHVQSTSSRIVNGMPKISRWPEGGVPPLVSVITFHVKYGADQEFVHAITQISEAIEKSNWPTTGYAWLTVVNGGRTPTYILALPYNSWADMKDPEKSLVAMLAEVYGDEGAGKIMGTFGKTVEYETSFIVAFRKDLSSMPGGM